MKTQRGNPVLFRSLQIEIFSERELHELNEFLQKFDHEKDNDVVSRLANVVKSALTDPNAFVEVDINNINSVVGGLRPITHKDLDDMRANGHGTKL